MVHEEDGESGADAETTRRNSQLSVEQRFEVSLGVADPRSFEWSGQEDDDDESPAELSPVRVLVALCIGIVLIVGVILGVKKAAEPTQIAATPWFAPYVDVTASPTYQFQDPSLNLASQMYLGFIVTQPGQSCTPSWGGAYSLDQAANVLDLDRRTHEVLLEGGSVFVSFGGQRNDELAVTCRNPADLAASYEAVIHRYQATGIDFDLEGSTLTNQEAMVRRSIAIADVQQALHAPNGTHLPVWLTLPVTPEGLTSDDLQAISVMLSHHVALTGVNLLTMDMGSGSGPPPNMAAWTEQALTTAEAQLVSAYQQHGRSLSVASAWNHLGATVMIGQNDTSNEVFTIGDAQQLVKFANQKGLSRISMWSLNRDQQCGASLSHARTLANDCSGVAQSNLEFSSIFSSARGQAPGASSTKAYTAPTTTTTPLNGLSDLPFPNWVSTNIYPPKYQVTWNGNVYQSKWTTQGQPPDAKVQYQFQTAWQLIGPILSTDHAPTTTTLPATTYPQWSASTPYPQGSKVLSDGLPYVSKYYAYGAPPDPTAVNSSVSPWQPLFTAPGEPPIN